MMSVSIFIPTYNVSAELLNDTISSVISQTYKNIEVWCVDDASTDDTPERLDEWARQDDRIHVIHKEHGGNVPYSWNAVLPKLNGEFTLYMSHDDLISNDCIELLVRAQERTGADCVIPTCVGFESDNLNPEARFEAFNKKSDVSDRTNMTGVDAFFTMLDYSIPGFALWRTSLIRSCGMPTESFNSDEGMQRIWASRCKIVSFEDKAKFYYRMVEGSITRGLKPYHYASLLTDARILEEARKIKEQNRISNINKQQLQQFCNRAIRNHAYLSAQFQKGKKNLGENDNGNITQILANTRRRIIPVTRIPYAFMLNLYYKLR